MAEPDFSTEVSHLKDVQEMVNLLSAKLNVGHPDGADLLTLSALAQIQARQDVMEKMIEEMARLQISMANHMLLQARYGCDAESSKACVDALQGPVDALQELVDHLG